MPARTRDIPSAGSPGAGIATFTEGERDALMRTATAAAGATGVEDVVELVADLTRAALDCACVSIGCYDQDRARLRVLVNAGDAGDAGDARERLPADETYPVTEFSALAEFVRSGGSQFVAIDDPDADASSLEALRDIGHESSIKVAIAAEGGLPWGEIWATTSPGAPRFRARGLRFLEAVAGQLVAIAERAERFSDVSRLAYEDPLTGLANRRALTERIDRACAERRADGGALTLLLCDVDNLKTLNDGRGHQAGDRALRRVGEALVAGAAAHPTALVGRLSGDEFAVVLEGAPIDAAREVAGTALRLLREDRDIAISLSCGAVAAGPGIEGSEALLRAADTAQYASKRRGGGQLCIAEGPGEPADAGPRRRGWRRTTAERLERETARLLDDLDSRAGDAPVLDRLELVISGVAEAVNAAAWTISLCPHDSREIRSVVTADSRDLRLRGLRMGLDDEVYLLDEYPATAKVVEAGAGAFVIDRHDRNADPAERHLLRELDFAAVLGGVASDEEGAFLLEIYGDGDTSGLPAAELRLQLLARAAVDRSSGARERLRRHDQRVRQLAATARLAERLAGVTSASAVVDAAVDELQSAFDLPVCAISRVTHEGQIEIAASRGEAAERLAGTGWSQRATLGLTGRALRDGELLRTNDVTTEPDYRVTATTGAMRSELCAPLYDGEAPWGVIDLQSERPSAFDQHDAQLVQAIADQVSAALRSVGRYTRLERAYRETEAELEALRERLGSTAAAS